jgi:hypothetical protein
MDDTQSKYTSNLVDFIKNYEDNVTGAEDNYLCVYLIK